VACVLGHGVPQPARASVFRAARAHFWLGVGYLRVPVRACAAVARLVWSLLVLFR